eukprot:s205_g12.t2
MRKQSLPSLPVENGESTQKCVLKPWAAEWPPFTTAYACRSFRSVTGPKDIGFECGGESHVFYRGVLGNAVKFIQIRNSVTPKGLLFHFGAVPSCSAAVAWLQAWQELYLLCRWHTVLVNDAAGMSHRAEKKSMSDVSRAQDFLSITVLTQ